MQCPECGVDVSAEQRFCNKCGTALAGVTGVAVAAAAGGGDAPRSRDDGVESAGPHTQDMMAIAPEWSAVSSTDRSDEPTGSIDTADLPATQPSPVASGTARAVTTPVEVDEPEAPQLYDFINDEDTDERAVWEAEAATSVQTTVAGAPTLGGPNSMATRQMPAAAHAAQPPPSSRRFRFSATLVAATATAIVGIVAIAANIVRITSDARIQPGDPVGAFRVGDWQVADLATNLAGAIVIATVGLFVGGLGTCFGMRWASGLVGGSGLGGAGTAALAIGMAERPIHAAKLFVATPTTEQFTITITRDAGYWLLFTFAVSGVLLFFLTVNLAGSDRRPALNPWLAAVGALAAVIAACGPLLPVGEASFDQNWVRTGTWADEPASFLTGRLLQVAALAFTGVVGFLQVRRWGIGVVIGGTLPVTWLAVSVLFDLGLAPIGPAYQNPGETGFDLHGVTIVGLVALVGLVGVAAVAAWDQAIRER